MKQCWKGHNPRSAGDNYSVAEHKLMCVMNIEIPLSQLIYSISAEIMPENVDE